MSSYRINLIEYDTVEIQGTTLYRIYYPSIDQYGGYTCMNSNISKSLILEGSFIVDSIIKDSFVDGSFINKSAIDESSITDCYVFYSEIKNSTTNKNSAFEVLENEDLFEKNTKII